MINQVPAVLISDFYGSIAIIVSVLLLILAQIDMINTWGVAGVAGAAIFLRLLAYHKQWHLPTLNRDS
jgi:uncharacterized membrane protein YeiH